jgi:lipopolysaccharide heptosyltransferase I
MPEPRRILLIKPSSLGDIVHALPVLAALRRRWPDAHIAWLVGAGFAPLLDDHPLIDQVIRFDRKRYGQMWWNPAASIAFWRFVARVRRMRFDLVIDLQGLVRSGLLAWFCGARRRIGFGKAREGAWLFYNERVSVSADVRHAVERNLCVARQLGLPVDPIEFPLAVTDDERDRARALLIGQGCDTPESFTAVLPGARWPTKQWPPERFSAAIDALQAQGACCVLLGAPDERPLGDRIAAACETTPVNLIGLTSLRELVGLLSLADRVLCCDSGPMHIAAALGRPMTALFGPTDPKRTGPFGAPAGVVRRELPCSPCRRRVCPLGHHACMAELSVATVLRSVREPSPGESRGATAPGICDISAPPAH